MATALPRGNDHAHTSRCRLRPRARTKSYRSGHKAHPSSSHHGAQKALQDRRHGSTSDQGLQTRTESAGPHGRSGPAHAIAVRQLKRRTRRDRRNGLHTSSRRQEHVRSNTDGAGHQELVTITEQTVVHSRTNQRRKKRSKTLGAPHIHTANNGERIRATESRTGDEPDVGQ